MPITINPTTQQQINNVARLSGQLQNELNQIRASGQVNEPMYQFLGHVIMWLGVLAQGCQNLLTDLRQVR